MGQFCIFLVNERSDSSFAQLCSVSMIWLIPECRSDFYLPHEYSRRQMLFLASFPLRLSISSTGTVVRCGCFKFHLILRTENFLHVFLKGNMTRGPWIQAEQKNLLSKGIYKYVHDGKRAFWTKVSFCLHFYDRPYEYF